ncbi:hypothetical protein Hanom_Chr04g00369571 [Helianthus anomalus]
MKHPMGLDLTGIWSDLVRMLTVVMVVVYIACLLNCRSLFVICGLDGMLYHRGRRSSITRGGGHLRRGSTTGVGGHLSLLDDFLSHTLFYANSLLFVDILFLYPCYTCEKGIMMCEIIKW